MQNQATHSNIQTSSMASAHQSTASNVAPTTSSNANAPNAQSHNGNLNTQEFLTQSKDAQTLVSVLKDMGIDDYEPRVINQLLEFSYRYVSNLLEDAKGFSSHAGKKQIDSEDIKMAIRTKVDYSFTTAPPRDLLLEISKVKNKNPLPPIKYHAGIRLPPDRFCLHAPNYVLKTQNVQKEDDTSDMMSTSVQSRQTTAQAVQENFLIPSDVNMFSSMPAKRARADEDDYDI